MPSSQRHVQSQTETPNSRTVTPSPLRQRHGRWARLNPHSGHSSSNKTSVKALLDIGCQSCVMDLDTLRKLDMSTQDLLPVRLQMRVANGNKLHLLGGVILRLTNRLHRDSSISECCHNPGHRLHSRLWMPPPPPRPTAPPVPSTPDNRQKLQEHLLELSLSTAASTRPCHSCQDPHLGLGK